MATLKEQLAETRARMEMFRNALDRFIEQRKEALDNPDNYASGYYLYEEKVPRQVELHQLEKWYEIQKRLLQ